MNVTVLAFVSSLILTGAVASLVPVNSSSEESVHADYHFVPAAGDVFGA